MHTGTGTSPPRVTAPCARLYALDENNKIKAEQVIIYVAQA